MDGNDVPESSSESADKANMFLAEIKTLGENPPYGIIEISAANMTAIYTSDEYIGSAGDTEEVKDNHERYTEESKRHTRIMLLIQGITEEALSLTEAQIQEFARSYNGVQRMRHEESEYGNYSLVLGFIFT